MKAAPKRVANTRTLIAVATAMILLGIVLSVSDDEGVGGWLTLLGLVGGVAALHRYGRLGPDKGRLAPAQED